MARSRERPGAGCAPECAALAIGMDIKAVIFDIGNVLIEWQPENYYDRAYGQRRREEVFDAVDLHGMNELIDQGVGFKDVIYDWADKYPAYRREIRDWHDHWIKLAAPAIDHSVRLLKVLRVKGVPVYTLTNFGNENFSMAQGHYPFLKEFDRFYVSGRMKTTKPGAQIYQMVEDDCGIAPQHLLFTDDRVDNIATAKSRGWQTHHFQNPQSWADCLVSAGLLRAEEAA